MKLPPTPLLLEPMDQKIFHVDTDEDTAEGIGLLWEAVELPGVRPAPAGRGADWIVLARPDLPNAV